MPRGFLVKRHKANHTVSSPTWKRRSSEDDPSDGERSASGSEQDENTSAPKIMCPLPRVDQAEYTCSPDSGYANSPGSHIPLKDDNENLAPRSTTSANALGNDFKGLSPNSRNSSKSPSSTPSSSPLSLHAPISLGSPPGFQFSAFDRLRVCSPQHRIGPAGPLFPGLHLLAHGTFPNGNYLPSAQCNANFAFPGNPLHAPLLIPAAHQSPFKAASSRILSPVNSSQQHKPKSPVSSTYSLQSHSPGKKRPSSESITSELTSLNAPKTPKSAKKSKAIRKIHFDEDKSSPVSGTIIRDAPSEQDGYKVCSGDIDSSLNLVEVTPEARAELEKIDNKIGDYICQLCRDKFDDAFQLAQHKCSRIVHVEYRCPECDKVFNCPANLASHRRWHKPRPTNATQGNNQSKSAPKNPKISATSSSPPQTTPDIFNGNFLPTSVNRPIFMGVPDRDPESGRGASPCGSSSGSDTGSESPFECKTCKRHFKREAYLRKHEATHHHAPPVVTPPSEPVFPCHYCGEVLKTEAGRTKHILQMHTPGLGSLQHHTSPNSLMGKHSPLPPTQNGQDRHHQDTTSSPMSSMGLTCKFCPSVFYSAPGLSRHVNKCHSGANRPVMMLPPLPQVNTATC